MFTLRVLSLLVLFSLQLLIFERGCRERHRRFPLDREDTGICITSTVAPGPVAARRSYGSRQSQLKGPARESDVIGNLP